MLRERFYNLISLLSYLSAFAAQTLPTVGGSARIRQHNPQILMAFKCSHLLFEHLEPEMWESVSLGPAQHQQSREWVFSYQCWAPVLCNTGTMYCWSNSGCVCNCFTWRFPVCAAQDKGSSFLVLEVVLLDVYLHPQGTCEPLLFRV